MLATACSLAEVTLCSHRTPPARDRQGIEKGVTVRGSGRDCQGIGKGLAIPKSGLRLTRVDPRVGG